MTRERCETCGRTDPFSHAEVVRLYLEERWPARRVASHFGFRTPDHVKAILTAHGVDLRRAGKPKRSAT